MQQAYEAIKEIFKDRIRLSPFNPNKPINILTEGASSGGIGFVFYQPTDMSKQEVTIFQANEPQITINLKLTRIVVNFKCSQS